MKRMIAILAGALVIGCKSQSPPPTAMVAPPSGPMIASAALVFDPPIIQTGPVLDLDRTNHGQAALVGFEESTTSFYDVFSLNRQATDGSDRIIKQAVTEKVGVTHR